MVGKRWLITVVLAANIMSATGAFAAVCNPAVLKAMDAQREQYVASAANMADQNYSRRPGTFASTTCLDALMSQGGVDIFFKPPSMDNILSAVKNFACEQASQIFDNLVGGSISAALGGGEILPGVSMVAKVNLSTKRQSTITNAQNVNVSLGSLFK